MTRTITLTHVGSGSDRRHRYKTIGGARKRALGIVGMFPRLSPEGYLVNRQNGDCLFVNGCEVTELFPEIER